MTELYFIEAKQLKHIAQGGQKWTLCLCFYNDKDYTGEVTGNEKYKKGRDCKTCFRKAKLKV